MQSSHRADSLNDRLTFRIITSYFYQEDTKSKLNYSPAGYGQSMTKTERIVQNTLLICVTSFAIFTDEKEVQKFSKKIGFEVPVIEG